MEYVIFPPVTAPAVPPIALAIAHLHRDQLADLIAAAIDLLDAIEPDSDLEPNGDELDGDHDAEDEFTLHAPQGPGCPLADPDMAVDDEAIDDLNQCVDPFWRAA